MRFEEEKEIRDTVRAVSHLVNVFGNDEVEFFIREMGREHRTLQQGFTRLCRAWFLYLATLEESHYDLRNEASVELARKIKGILEDNPLPLI
jgi:hypothetical protein